MSEAIRNSRFENDLQFWVTHGGSSTCKASIVKNEGPSALKRSKYAAVVGRTMTWQGLAQNIESNLISDEAYAVSGEVAIQNADSAPVYATLALSFSGNPQVKYLRMASTTAKNNEFVKFESTFPGFKTIPERVLAYLEGPPGGVDLLIASFQMQTLKPPGGQFPQVANIVTNGNFQEGASGWVTMAGSETMTVHPACHWGSPDGPPCQPSNVSCQWSDFYPIGSQAPSSGRQVPLAGPTGAYLVVGNRSQEWQGPKHYLGDRVRPFQTYASSAWVRVGAKSGDKVGPGPQRVNFALMVDGKWANGGMVEAVSDKWARCTGSFRIEKTTKDVWIYFQGPLPGVDLWLAGVQVVPQDVGSLIQELKRKADKVRRSRAVIRVVSKGGQFLEGVKVSLQQRSSTFALGTCINSRDLRNDKYQKYVVGHFSHVVFENELKWVQMEWERGNVNYKPADDMLRWAEVNGLKARGHCVFWDNEVPRWLKTLPDETIAEEVDKRIRTLLSRYRGRFLHYDVNNEMMHGGYFASKLGRGIYARMFQLCNQTDPSAALFVNDYNVENGDDWKSTPDKYCQHIRDLQAMGAPVQGIGVQGHISAPVGYQIAAAFDILGTVGLPIWITELTVVSSDEKCRADDLEMMLRGAFAHPSVHGVILWGFWEGDIGKPAMYIKNAHLVNSDWSLNEAGRRLEAIHDEWTKGSVTAVTNKDGQVEVNLFHGVYSGLVETETMREFEISLTASEDSVKEFTVEV